MAATVNVIFLLNFSLMCFPVCSNGNKVGVSTVFQYRLENISHSSEPEIWRALMLAGGEVIRHMTPSVTAEMKLNNASIILDESISTPARFIVDYLIDDTMFSIFSIDVKSVKLFLQNFKLMKSQLSFVIIATDDNNLVRRILDHVMTNSDFYWTTLIHVTEWIILTCSMEVQGYVQHKETLLPDFVTLISATRKNSISVEQKNRVQNFNEVLNIELENLNDLSNINMHNSQFHNKMVGSELGKWPMFVNDYIIDKVRQCGTFYLQTRRSVMDGAHLKVSLFIYPYGQDNLVMAKKSGNNETEPTGFYVRLLQIFSQSLGFTYDIVLVNDSGYYGTVDSSGHYTGILGQLSRREAAFTVIPLTMTEWRINAVDFIFVSSSTEYNKHIYRLPEPGSGMDMTYLDIIQIDLAVKLILGLVLLMAVIGSTVHVVSRSCTSATPQPCSFDALGELYTFPDHCCFEVNSYANQSGRVLKATWGVFWLILSSAYSAYLTTSFAVQSKELRFDSITDLIKDHGYAIGVNGGLSAFIVKLNSSSDADLKKLFTKLRSLNQTDPMTFSHNATYHMDKVRQGKYVFVTMGPVPDMEVNVDHDDRLLRSHVVKETDDYLCTALVKDAYFKEDLNRYMLKLKESGISDKLKRDTFKYKKLDKEELVNEETPVILKRIEVIIYIVLGCLVISICCLFIELVIDRTLKCYEQN